MFDSLGFIYPYFIAAILFVAIVSLLRSLWDVFI